MLTVNYNGQIIKADKVRAHIKAPGAELGQWSVAVYIRDPHDMLVAYNTAVPLRFPYADHPYPLAPWQGRAWLSAIEEPSRRQPFFILHFLGTGEPTPAVQ